MKCILCGGRFEGFRDDVKDFEYNIEGEFPLVKCVG